MKKMTRYLSILLTLALIAGVLGGCGGNPATSASAPEDSTLPSVPAAEEADAEVQASPAAGSASELEASAEAEEGETLDEAGIYVPKPNPFELPLADELLTYTAMGVTNPNMSSFGSMGDYAIWQRLQERTNIGFEWSEFSMFTISDQHSLLVAANDLPEIVCGNYYTGGVASAIDEEVYWDLAPYLEEFAPNYYDLIQVDGIRQQVYSDDGYVMFFDEIAEKEFAPNNGILIRQDMLDKVGKDVPVTYDDYTDVLAAFKSEFDMEAPMYATDMDYNVFSAGFGIDSGFSAGGHGGFSLDDDKNLVYSPISDTYKEYLKQFSDWYKNGYIYKDFYCIPFGEANNYRAEYMGADKSAICFCYCEFASQFVFEDSNATLSAGYIPRQTADQQVHLTDGVDAQVKDGWCVSTNCSEEKLETLCQFMNYLYTEEGAELCNWGIEGETFEYQPDGSKWFTDEIMNNPEMTQTQALIFNFMYQGPCYADYTKYNISTLTTWKDYADVWASADNAYKIPTLSLTADEESKFAAASSDVTTYMSEQVIRFMLGEADIDAEWDEYVSHMESLGCNDMVEIYETAYARFLNK